MGVPVKPSCAVVFLMVLAIGVSLRLPEEDVLDAVYDESETLPCEVIPLASTAGSPVTASRTQALRRKLVVRSPLPQAPILDTHVPRSTDTRALSELLCTLLC